MLLAVSELDVAFAAVVVGGVTGIAGILAPLWLGRKSRRHERDLAREERLYSDLRLACAEALRFAYAVRGAALNDDPAAAFTALLTPTWNADQVAAYARASVIGSPEVDELLEDVNHTLSLLVDAAKSGVPLKPTQDAVNDAVIRAEQRMRAEVRQLVSDADHSHFSSAT